MVAIQPRMRALTRLMPRIRSQMRAVATGEAHQQFLFEDELLSGVVRSRVNTCVHADGVHGAGFDVDALRGAGGRATQARDAARRAIVTLREAMHPAEARRVRALLLRVRDAVDAVFDGFEHRVVALTEGHLFRILKEMLHRDAEALGNLGNVGLHGGGTLRARNRRAHNFFRTQSCGFVLHADIRALRVPPAAAAYSADDEDKVLRLWTGLARNTTK